MAVASSSKDVSVSVIADPSPEGEFSVNLKLPKFSKEVRHEDFLDALSMILDVNDVKSLGQLRNTNEWQVTFDNPDARNKLFIAGNVTVRTKKCVVSAPGDKFVLGRVHWLPAEVKDETIKEILQNFGEVIHLAKEKVSNHPNSPDSLVRFFVIDLSKKCTCADIPHYLFINHHQGLVIIKGRDPMCLECDTVGHRKFECPIKKQKVMEMNAKSRRGKPAASNAYANVGHRSNTVSKATATQSSSTVPKSKNRIDKQSQTASVSTTRVRRISALSDAMQNLIITKTERERSNQLADAERSANIMNALNLPGPSTVTHSETNSASDDHKKRKRKRKKNTSDTYNLISAEANGNDTSGSGQHSPKGSLDSGIAINGNSTLVNMPNNSVNELPNIRVPAWVVPVVNESEASSNVNTPSPSNLNQRKKKKNKKKTGTSQIPGLTHP